MASESQPGPVLARVLLCVALLLPLLAPAVEAQAPNLAVAVVAEPFPRPIAPLEGIGTTNVTAEVPCALLRGESGVLKWWADSVPTWLDGVVFTPQEAKVDLLTCGADRVAVHATLTARATRDAPAFSPQALVIRASFESGGQNVTSAAQLMVEADYFAVLEVHVGEAVRVGAPGERLVYPLEIRNLGNGPTRIGIELLDVSEGYVPELPGAFTLLPGGSRTIGVVLTNPSGVGYINEVGVLSFRVHAEHAERRGDDTDEAMISLLATAKGVDAPVPAPALPLVLALVALAAYSRRVFSR